MEGDLAQLGDLLGVYNFNPLPPHGGRQGGSREKLPVMLFQSTPSAWRETRCRTRW